MILVTGATGFVGGHVVPALRAAEREVRCLVRNPWSRAARRLAEQGCQLVEGDMTEPDSLRRAAEGCDTVVHLVAIIAGKPEQFERIMIQGTRDLLAAANEQGVGRIVQMSALGTNERSKDVVPYFHAKWEIERMLAGSGLAHVIFRPSFVFGSDGGVLPTFVRQVRLSPVTPVVGDGKRKLQPIWCDDVGAFFAAAAEKPETAGTFDLGGPDVVDYNQLFERIKATLGKRRPTVHVPMGLVRMGAAMAEVLPKPPVTRDMLKMLEFEDNVGDPRPAIETFGIEPIGLDEQLKRATARARS